MEHIGFYVEQFQRRHNHQRLDHICGLLSTLVFSPSSMPYKAFPVIRNVAGESPCPLLFSSPAAGLGGATRTRSSCSHLHIPTNSSGKILLTAVRTLVQRKKVLGLDLLQIMRNISRGGAISSYLPAPSMGSVYTLQEGTYLSCGDCYFPRITTLLLLLSHPDCPSLVASRVALEPCRLYVQSSQARLLPDMVSYLETHLEEA